MNLIQADDVFRPYFNCRKIERRFFDERDVYRESPKSHRVCPG